jgi:rubrerythrin
MTMKMHRCRICGETYLGHDTPSNCPFCGAHASYFVATEDFPEDVNDIQLTEVERADLDTSIEIETSNTRFYLAMAARKDNPKLSSAYKRLAKIEAEHCSVFCKLARVPKPADLLEPGTELGAWLDDIDESLRRETRASGLYAEFAARATSPRLTEIWGAVSEVEADHIALDEVAKRYV